MRLPTLSNRSALLVVVALAALIAARCDCGGGGMGDPCDTSEDCDPGLFCAPSTLTCEPIIGSDSAIMGTDSGAGSDSAMMGADLGVGSDSAMIGSDASGGSDSAMIGTDSGTGSDSGPICVDVDGDGFTDCAGDCNDSDPTVYPGAPEICGDGVTNDCNSADPPDTGCASLGTYVAPPPVGSAGGMGTQTDPVDTINQGIANSMLIEAMGGPADLPVYVAAGTAGPGIYNENISLVEGISLLGGYESSGWTQDPSVNITIINPQVTGLYAGAGITRTTWLQGFTINSMRIGPMLMGPTTAIEIDGGEPTITGNVINAITTSGIDVVISIANGGLGSGISPLIERNAINAAGGGSYSSAIAGIQVSPEIVANSITMASSPYSIGIGCGGCPPATYIGYNDIDGSGAISDGAAGIELEGAAAVIEANYVYPGACTGSGGPGLSCIGLNILSSGLQSLIFNNVVFGGLGNRTVGLNYSLGLNGVIALAATEIINNYINGGGMFGTVAFSESMAVTIEGFSPVPLNVVYLHNNNLHAGDGEDRYCVREYVVNLDPVNVFHNNFRVLPSPLGGLEVYYRNEDAVNLLNVTMVNALPDVPSGMNIAVNCMLVSEMVGGDFHLTAGSMCINAGDPMLAPAIDFEGDPRVGGPDIGPDEL